MNGPGRHLAGESSPIGLSIIIVTYNSSGEIRQCLGSVVEQQGGDPAQIIVVDNASTDGTPDLVRREFPHVVLLENETNTGFAAANNRGIREARGTYILLLNPDTVVVDHAILKTVAFLDATPLAGIVGCTLRFPNGQLQHSVRSFPSVWGLFCEATFLSVLFPDERRIRSDRGERFRYDRSSRVDWMSGAFLMFRREVIEKIGLLDEQFFMYSEEVDFCYRACSAGFQIWYFAGATVHHYWEGTSTLSRRSRLWVNGAEKLFIEKHFSGLKRWTAKCLKYVGIAVRVPAYVLEGIVTLQRIPFLKAGIALYVLRHLPSPTWTYRPGHAGPVAPWPVP